MTGEWHTEDGSLAVVTDTSGNAFNGAITNAVWLNGRVPRTAGNSGTNDGVITWGANPAGIAVALGEMVADSQPSVGATADPPTQDILPGVEVSDWFVEPDVAGSLLTNPVRPFVTLLSDNSTLTELQSWRLLALAFILLVTVGTAWGVRGHYAITGIAAGVSILAVVVLTIFPMWALIFVGLVVIAGLIAERSPSV